MFTKRHGMRMRRGSVALEATFLLPIFVMFALAAVYVLEAMVFRQDLQGATRVATAQVAAQLPCLGPQSTVPERPLSVRDATIRCTIIDDERGLRRVSPFFRSMSDAYGKHWSGFWSDIDPNRPLRGHIGRGAGTFEASGLSWLQTAFGATGTETIHRRVDRELWTHHSEPWRAAMDPIFWRRLSQRGTARLFPNVFPSR
jgi:hypothetical protein